MKGEAAASLSTDINVENKTKQNKNQWDEILEKAQGFGWKESAHSFLY